jgi:hypothetical protein
MRPNPNGRMSLAPQRKVFKIRIQCTDQIQSRRRKGTQRFRKGSLSSLSLSWFPSLTYPFLFAVFPLLSGWSQLPLAIALSDGIKHMLNMCVGCRRGFTCGCPSHHACEFGQKGFPWNDDPESKWAQPCGVQYHAQCIQAGVPFHTFLPNQQGLVYPWQAPAPHYVCELCVIGAHLKWDLSCTGTDVALLVIERVHQIDFMSGWSMNTLKNTAPICVT